MKQLMKDIIASTAIGALMVALIYCLTQVQP